MEAVKWEKAKVPANAVRYWQKFCKITQHMGSSWRLTDGLDRIIQHLQNGYVPDADELTALHSFVTSMPPDLEPLSRKIKLLLER